MQPIKEKLKEKIVAFFESEGIGKVAERAKISPQALRDLRSGRNAVTLDTLLALYGAYPTAFGPIIQESFGIEMPEPKSEEKVSASAVSHVSEDTINKLAGEIVEWSVRFKDLQNEKNNWRDRFLRLNDNILKRLDPELSFLQSGSRVTALVRAGFKHYDTEAKVMQHPATLFRQVSAKTFSLASY